MSWSAVARWTTLAKVLCVLALVLLGVGQTMGQGGPLLSSADSAIAIDEDGLQPTSGYPGAEGPANAIDGTLAKYLNFGDVNSGFIVTPLLALPVESFQITTANDGVTRDPTSWVLYGFNGPLLSTDNSTGMAEAWTLIDMGAVALPAARNTLGPVVDVLDGAAGAGYDNYKMVFPTNGGSSLFQIAEIQLYDANAAAGNPILTPGDPILAIDEDVFPDSSYPGGESPAMGIDQDSMTKYLNFGKENSGIIITNSTGPVLARVMGLTTANDWPGRDPGSYELYGTNDPILSMDNSEGMGGENYTLISSGPLSLPGDSMVSGDGRFMQVLVPINAGNAYTSYKLVFPTLKDTSGPNVDSMQIADIQLYVYAVPEPATFALLAMGGLVVLAASRRRNG